MAAGPSWQQLTFDLDLPPHFGREDFLPAAPNAAALRMIDAWPQWSDWVQLLIGAPGTGKSHLAAIWAARSGAEIIAARTLAAADPFVLATRPALVIEDAEEIGQAEANLFHLINLVRERQSSLLLTTRARPELWGIATADLLSRLRLAPAVELGMPDDGLLTAVLIKLFNDRQLIVDAAVIDYIALHIDRSLDRARQVVALLDRAALASGRKVTRALARELLQGFDAEAAED